MNDVIKHNAASCEECFGKNQVLYLCWPTHTIQAIPRTHWTCTQPLLSVDRKPGWSFPQRRPRYKWRANTLISNQKDVDRFRNGSVHELSCLRACQVSKVHARLSHEITYEPYVRVRTTPKARKHWPKTLTTDLKTNYEKQTCSSDVDKFKNRCKQNSKMRQTTLDKEDTQRSNLHSKISERNSCGKITWLFTREVRFGTAVPANPECVCVCVSPEYNSRTYHLNVTFIGSSDYGSSEMAQHVRLQIIFRIPFTFEHVQRFQNCTRELFQIAWVIARDERILKNSKFMWFDYCSVWQLTARVLRPTAVLVKR